MTRILKIVCSYNVQFLTFCSILNPLLTDAHSPKTVLYLLRAFMWPPPENFFIYLELSGRLRPYSVVILLLKCSWFPIPPQVHQFPSTIYSLCLILSFLRSSLKSYFAGLWSGPYALVVWASPRWTIKSRSVPYAWPCCQLYVSGQMSILVLRLMCLMVFISLCVPMDISTWNVSHSEFVVFPSNYKLL